MESARRLQTKRWLCCREIAQIGGHTLEINAKRIGGVAIVQDGTPLPAEGHA